MNALFGVAALSRLSRKRHKIHTSFCDTIAIENRLFQFPQTIF